MGNNNTGPISQIADFIKGFACEDLTAQTDACAVDMCHSEGMNILYHGLPGAADEDPVLSVMQSKGLDADGNHIDPVELTFECVAFKVGPDLCTSDPDAEPEGESEVALKGDIWQKAEKGEYTVLDTSKMDGGENEIMVLIYVEAGCLAEGYSCIYLSVAALGAAKESNAYYIPADRHYKGDNCRSMLCPQPEAPEAP